MDTKSFIIKAQAVHGTHCYDYSLVDYKKSNIKIQIICLVHGIFWQSPNSHLHKYGCYTCARNRIVQAHLMTTDEFIQKAIKVHSSLYDYSNVYYKKSKQKVEIICSKHGSFWQKPNEHLNGKGCDACGGTKTLSTKEFIEKARKIHKDRYNYSKTIYVNGSKTIEITCLIHGIFQQRASDHLSGAGCTACTKYPKFISKKETQWLSSLNVPIVGRQHKLVISRKWFNVDGFIPETNTVYEFLGDYWHGNPKKYCSDEINEVIGKPFGQLYTETIERIELFRKHGYNVEYIWESDYCGT